MLICYRRDTRSATPKIIRLSFCVKDKKPGTIWNPEQFRRIILLRKRKDGIPEMKNKLTALLAALLLSFSLLPNQALAASLPDPSTPPAISEPETPETPDTPNDPEKPGSLAPQSGASAQSEGPGLTDTEH